VAFVTVAARTNQYNMNAPESIAPTLVKQFRQIVVWPV